MANGDALAGFSDADLLSELARRLRAAQRIERPEHWCDDCRHVRTWNGENPPANWTVCRKGHRPDFYFPGEADDPHAGGFFLDGCPDRADPDPPPPPAPKAPKPDPPRPPPGSKPVAVGQSPRRS